MQEIQEVELNKSLFDILIGESEHPHNDPS